jgi:hypothetical protein
MLGRVFEGFKFLHAVLLTLSAIGFFIFWARTKFWLPKYVHILAGIGLVVALWCESIMPDNAPLNKEGPIAKFLFALILPAMVYLFFLFCGGQKAAFARRFQESTICHCCNLPVTADQTRNRAHELTSCVQHTCPHCGQRLT